VPVPVNSRNVPIENDRNPTSRSDGNFTARQTVPGEHFLTDSCCPVTPRDNRRYR
jgi:hypothetical protein